MAGPEAGHIARAAAASGDPTAGHATHPPPLCHLLAGVLVTDFADPDRALLHTAGAGAEVLRSIRADRGPVRSWRGTCPKRGASSAPG